MKRTLKKLYIKMLETRQSAADYRIAELLRHEYPINTSLHSIVADLRKKRKENLTAK